MWKWGSAILIAVVVSLSTSSCTWRTSVIQVPAKEPVMLLEDVEGVRIAVPNAEGKLVPVRGKLFRGSWVTYIDPSELD